MGGSTEREAILSIPSFGPPFNFPARDPCFGDASNSTSVCQVPTGAMITFLNITDATSYFQTYCLNPPGDSCAFGYCPNPDVASPAVRASTYFTTVVSSILVLYSPEEVASSFFAQLLNVYSLIIAAMISVANRNLTKPHTVVALGLSASPLSVYLIIYVFRSIIGNQNRLKTVFGKGQWLNRAAVLALFPIWLSVLVFSALHEGAWHFQQRACDDIVGQNQVIRVFFLPFLVFFIVFPWLSAVLSGLFLGAWIIAIYLQRHAIWTEDKKRLPWLRIWRNVVDPYPFIRFCTVIALPTACWILNVEFGVWDLLLNEKFSASYGQLLALFVTIQPLVQLFLLLPRVWRWFVDLTWVRLLTCRRSRGAPGYDTVQLQGKGLPVTDSYMHKPTYSARSSSAESIPLQYMPTQ